MAGDEKRVKLIVAADEPALMFSSIQNAESYLEAIDVLDGVYRAAFGPAGERFNIEAAGDRVVIRRLDETPDPEGLVRLLRRASGANLPEDADLPTLLAWADRYITD